MFNLSLLLIVSLGFMHSMLREAVTDWIRTRLAILIKIIGWPKFQTKINLLHTSLKSFFSTHLSRFTQLDLIRPELVCGASALWFDSHNIQLFFSSWTQVGRIEMEPVMIKISLFSISQLKIKIKIKSKPCTLYGEK